MRRQLLPFAVVAALGFAVQVVLVVLFSDRWGWSLPVSTAASVEAAVLHNWAWHECWTWRRRVTAAHRLQRLVAFHAANGAISLLGNAACAEALARTTTLALPWRTLLSVALVGGLNFLVAERVVFRMRPTPASARPALAGTLTPAGARVRLGAALVAALTLMLVSPLSAAAPPPGAIAGWNAAIARIEADIARGGTTPTAAGGGAAAPDGIDVSELPAVEIPGATLQHWGGAVFVPHVRLDALLEALEQTPPAQPDVPAARILWHDGHRLGLYLRLVRRTLMTVTYDTEHAVTFERLTPHAAIGRSVMTAAREVRNAGTADECVSSPGDDRGFLWRLNVYWWYVETPAGVRVVMESLTLGRETPFLLRALAGPVVRRIAAESVRSALDGVRNRFAPAGGEALRREPPSSSVAADTRGFARRLSGAGRTTAPATALNTPGACRP